MLPTSLARFLDSLLEWPRKVNVMTRMGALCLTAILSSAVLVSGQDSAQEELDTHGVIKRGAELGDAPEVSLADVVKDTDEFVDEIVTVEGEVGGVCRMKGCWMGLVAPESPMGVRVTFKDYGFFVPRESRGLIARMEGTFHASTLSKEEADHLESEGAKLSRNPDGTVTELSFVASGVELRRPGSPH